MPATPVLESLPVGKVHPDPANPRSDLTNLDELAASIRSVGLLEPIVVRAHTDRPGEFMIVAGHRRHAAHVKAGMKMIPAIVREGVDDREALAAMLVENLQREDLDPLDEARAYRRLTELGWKQKDIADAVARSAAHISKRIKLLDLPEPVAKAVRDGHVTVETGYLVAKTLGTKGVDRDQLVAGIVEELSRDRNEWEEADVEEEVKWLTEDVARKAEYEGKVEALRRQLTLSGQSEITEREWSKHRRVEGYNPFLEGMYDDHLKEPCSAYTIVSRGGDPVPEYWCVDPARHLPGGDSKLRAPDETAALEVRRVEAEKAQSDADRARTAARERRRAFYTDAVARAHLTEKGALPVNVFGQFHQATRMLIHTLNGQDLDMVAELLDLDGWKASASYGAKQARVVAEFNDSPVRVNMAVLLAATESIMAYFHLRPDPHDYRLQFLEQLGYAGEQATLEGAGA